MRLLKKKKDPERSYPWWGQTHSWPRIGVRRIRISFSVAPRLHLSRLPRARSRSLFFPLHHGPTRRKGWFVDLTSETVGASLTYRRGHRTMEVDVPMQQTDSLIADVDWLATSYDRSTWIHHEPRAHGGKKKNRSNGVFLISTDSVWLCCHTYWWSRSSSKNTW